MPIPTAPTGSISTPLRRPPELDVPQAARFMPVGQAGTAHDGAWSCVGDAAATRPRARIRMRPQAAVLAPPIPEGR